MTVRLGAIHLALLVLGVFALGMLLGSILLAQSTPGAPAKQPAGGGASPSPLASATPTLSATSPGTPTSSPVPPTPAPTATRPPATPPTSTPTPTAPPSPTPTPTKTPRIPVQRETKWGVGAYRAGGHVLDGMLVTGAGVILLMDPTVEWAREVRRYFPKAFIVGRRFVQNQPLDNPEARGAAFADFVAELAVPLKGTINAWMSYNEVTSHNDYANYRAYNLFHTAFANRLRDQYGIDAVAGNDGPGTVEPEDYATYFSDAIRASAYLGIHAYAPKGARSMRDRAESYVLRYRQIRQALDAAGIPGVRMVITESGLWDGWLGVVPAEAMAEDFAWYTRELERDDYVVGQAAFGLFGDGGRWERFDLLFTPILEIMGRYVPGR